MRKKLNRDAMSQQIRQSNFLRLLVHITFCPNAKSVPLIGGCFVDADGI